MKVELIRHTSDALDLLIGTKTTRMGGKRPEEMSEDEKREHYSYMLDTIKSPFEFVDYIFEIDGVSKNFTHQFVRTRTGAYQQQTSRAVEVDVYGDTVMPDAFNKSPELLGLWHDAMADADAHYRNLQAAGAELQDARAVCPSNMGTKITAKFNLRTLSDMSKVRLCARTQGEYQQVFRAMRERVLEVHPWADSLLQVSCVATGQCAFPRWGGKVMDEVYAGESNWKIIYQCPHYRPWMDLSKNKEALRIEFWSAAEIAQANPVAKDGRSM